ncbi:alpha/beta hydrolase family protein [Thermomonospora umbrina]|uniref:Poly(ethylene terephthalate) hydrolase n=1 Tax=Thermomonospora umbrina TaxID=111806 RepID=A0A3D9SUD5_9ACTN|nr:dienelactone hydrolase family protein [Thermomonospora umbrina]REE97633.1 dienelactone hydrolase [Thermomonospora umbrina]
MKAILARLLAVTAALAVTAGVGLTSPAGRAQAAANPYQRGPVPTEQSVRDATGPFAFSQVQVTDESAEGFGSATIFYPNTTAQGTFGGVAVSPGFFGPAVSVTWVGRRLASHGFVTIVIETTSATDQPTSRGRQMLAALDHLTTKSPAAVRQRLDKSRLAVAGHSMGGGGTLYAAWARPSLKAAVPLAPWHTIKNWSAITVPTMILGGTEDPWAPVAEHAEKFYGSLTGARERAYAEVTKADHNTFNWDTPLIGKFVVAWMKRFVDDDLRYDRFLCPPPADAALTEYRASCPHA